MLAAANFHRSSRSFWENYFQLCHDYSCKCRNVRLTALSLTADDQEIAAGRAQDTQTGSCSESVRRASHFYNDNNGAVTCYGQDTQPAELSQLQEDTCIDG